MSLDKVIFKDKTFANLLEEIYTNKKKKDTQIQGLIQELQPLIEDTGDATLVVPLIKEYMDIGLKNDEILVKLSQIVQRIVSIEQAAEMDFGLSESEKAALLKEIESVQKASDNPE